MTVTWRDTRQNIYKNHEIVTQSAVCLYLCSIRPEHLAVQQRVEGVSQTLVPLRTVATDDVTGGADAPEEIRADGGGGDSRGDVSQVHIDGDFLFRGGFRSCDESETFLKSGPKQSNIYSHTWIL